MILEFKDIQDRLTQKKWFPDQYKPEDEKSVQESLAHHKDRMTKGYLTRSERDWLKILLDVNDMIIKDQANVQVKGVKVNGKKVKSKKEKSVKEDGKNILNVS